MRLAVSLLHCWRAPGASHARVMPANDCPCTSVLQTFAFALLSVWKAAEVQKSQGLHVCYSKTCGSFIPKTHNSLRPMHWLRSEAKACQGLCAQLAQAQAQVTVCDLKYNIKFHLHAFWFVSISQAEVKRLRSEAEAGQGLRAQLAQAQAQLQSAREQCTHEEERHARELQEQQVLLEGQLVGAQQQLLSLQEQLQQQQQQEPQLQQHQQLQQQQLTQLQQEGGQGAVAASAKVAPVDNGSGDYGPGGASWAAHAEQLEATIADLKVRGSLTYVSMLVAA